MRAKTYGGHVSKDLYEYGDTWCPMPWIGLAARSVGDLRFCCHAQKSPNQGLLKDSDGRILNLTKDTLAQGKNADLIKDVRLSMLKGEKHPSCQRCWEEEDAGFISRRQSEIREWKSEGILKDRLEKVTQEDGSINESDAPLHYLDLRFGNKCNLSCKMCSPTESNQWYKYNYKIFSPEFTDGGRKLEILKINENNFKLKEDPYQWHEDNHFWEDLKNYLPTIKRIYLAGGEPLLIEPHFSLLETCIEQGYAKNIILEYNSNITAVSERILNIWKHFRKIEVGISIDGVGKVNDYIRYPSQWNQVYQKLQMIDTAEGNIKLWWAATIQVLNMLHLPDMMLWNLEQNFQRVNKTPNTKMILTPHPLNNPKFLSIKMFPEKSKKKIMEIFDAAKKEGTEKIMAMSFYNENQKSEYTARYRNILDAHIYTMNSEDFSSYLDKFWGYINTLDELQGTSLKDTCPETYDLLI